MIFAAKINKTLLAVIALLLLTPMQSVRAMASESPAGYPVIYQLQTGTMASASQELITIFNNSPNPVDITSWKIIYKSSTANTSTELVKFSGSQLNNHLYMPSLGYVVIGSKEFAQANPDISLTAVFNAGVASTGGHIVLTNSQNEEVDTLGYGTATKPELVAKPAPPAGKILQRKFADPNRLIDTNNNSDDFDSVHLQTVQPNTYQEYIEPEEVHILPIYITEVLPNPAGADTGKEYIEFYNPNSVPILLSYYIIQVGPSYSKTVSLPSIEIPPLTHVALNDQELGVTLPNTSASLRILYSDNTTEIFIMPAYNQLDDDVVWALENEEWMQSYTQTPNMSNMITISKPCNAGYERNTTSGNCQKVSTVALKSSLSCPVGQTRNIETNRCRKVEIVKATVACEAGKVRNLATGRCKNVESGQTVKTCPAGQERNKETGRCRKAVAKSSDIPKVKDLETPFVENNAKWWAAGIAGSGSAGYAAYEWRNEFRRKLGSIKTLLGALFNKEI